MSSLLLNWKGLGLAGTCASERAREKRSRASPAMRAPPGRVGRGREGARGRTYLCQVRRGWDARSTRLRTGRPQQQRGAAPAAGARSSRASGVAQPPSARRFLILGNFLNALGRQPHFLPDSTPHLRCRSGRTPLTAPVRPFFLGVLLEREAGACRGCRKRRGRVGRFTLLPQKG